MYNSGRIDTKIQHSSYPGSWFIDTFYIFFIFFYVCVLSRSVMSDSLCNPMGYSPPGSSVYGIFQARILEWFSISFSKESSPPRDQTSISCVSCFAGGFFMCWAIQESLSLTLNLGYISNWLWQIKWNRSEIAQEPSQVFKRLPIPSWSLRHLSEEAGNRLPVGKRHTAHHSCH